MDLWFINVYKPRFTSVGLHHLGPKIPRLPGSPFSLATLCKERSPKKTETWPHWPRPGVLKKQIWGLVQGGAPVRVHAFSWFISAITGVD